MRTFVRLPVVVPVALAFALACSGGSAPTEPAAAPPAAPAAPEAPATPAPTAAPMPVVAPPPAPKTFDEAAFTCCDNDRADRLLDKYLEIESRLVKGTEDGIAGQYTGLHGVAQGAIEKGGFGPDQNAILKRIADNATASGTEDLAGKRKRFKDISADVILFLREHDGTGKVKVATTFCPMFEGGATWLQTESSVMNPYYGSDMLSCGNFQ